MRLFVHEMCKTPGGCLFRCLPIRAVDEEKSCCGCGRRRRQTLRIPEKETGLKINPIYHVYWRGDSDKLRCARTARRRPIIFTRIGDYWEEKKSGEMYLPLSCFCALPRRNIVLRALKTKTHIHFCEQAHLHINYLLRNGFCSHCSSWWFIRPPFGWK